MSSDNLVQVIDRPLAQPGICAICGFSGSGVDPVGDRRKFIDWGFSLDFYGAVIFCETCIIHVANQLGYISPDESERLNLELINLMTKLQSMESENAKLRHALSNLDFLSCASVATSGISEYGDSEEGQDDSEFVESSNVGGFSDVSDDEQSSGKPNKDESVLLEL